MSVLIQKIRLDYDDYPIGQPFQQVGPFDDDDAAIGWLESHNEYTHGFTRRGRGHYVEHSGHHGTRIQIVNPFENCTCPEDY
jgi:hypothetical protein